jgi:hypothetical protein
VTTIDQVKDQAQEQAGALAGRAKGLIIGQIDQRSTQVGSSAIDHAQSIREIAEQLRGKGQSPAANLADTIASKLENAGFYLSESGGERIVADMEALARRQPLLTLAAGVAAGVLAARVLKASASARYAAYGQKPYTGSRYYED